MAFYRALRHVAWTHPRALLLLFQSLTPSCPVSFNVHQSIRHRACKEIDGGSCAMWLYQSGHLWPSFPCFLAFSSLFTRVGSLKHFQDTCNRHSWILTFQQFRNLRCNPLIFFSFFRFLKKILWCYQNGLRCSKLTLQLAPMLRTCIICNDSLKDTSTESQRTIPPPEVTYFIPLCGEGKDCFA